VPGRDPEILLTEHVPVEMLADEHYAEQHEHAIHPWPTVDPARADPTTPGSSGPALVFTTTQRVGNSYTTCKGEQ
jgi:hypothetical protein